MNYQNQGLTRPSRPWRGHELGLILVLAASFASGQTQVDLRTQSKGDSGIVTQIVGSGNPNGLQNCTAPTASIRRLYFDSVSRETWQCVATNTWKKILDTDGTGPVVMTGSFNTTDLTEPITAGRGAMQFGDNGLEYFPKGGALSRTVVPGNCTAPTFVSAVAADGTLTCTTPSAVRATDIHTGTIANIASGNLLAAAPAGTYRVSAYIHTSVPEGAACTVNVDIGYTYNGGSKTLQIVSAHDLNVDEQASGGTRTIQADASANVTRALTASCSRTAYSYDYSLVLERIN